MLRLAADFDMPETELFGRAPQGLNATGENERKKWFDSLGGFQTTDIAPPLKRFYHLLSLAKDSPVKRKKSGSGDPARWTIPFLVCSTRPRTRKRRTRISRSRSAIRL